MNLMTTLDSMVRVTPETTVMSAAIIYGLPAAFQVVLEVIFEFIVVAALAGAEEMNSAPIMIHMKIFSKTKDNLFTMPYPHDIVNWSKSKVHPLPNTQLHSKSLY